MNTILSICEEYSDNVWYSNCGNTVAPEKVALELEKEYKIQLLKAVFNHGYILDSERITDNNQIVITLVKNAESEQ